MERAGSLRQKKTKERTNEGLTVSVYSKIPSNKDMFLDLQWAVHDVCDVDRRDFEVARVYGVGRRVLGDPRIFGHKD